MVIYYNKWEILINELRMKQKKLFLQLGLKCGFTEICSRFPQTSVVWMLIVWIPYTHQAHNS
jgi:hypothetical protein